jgi:hypothetical protein
MATPTCPKGDCKGDTFEPVHAASSFSQTHQKAGARLALICCTKCGAVVGVIDNHSAALIEAMAKKG